ncbi:Glu/Leu/Phe/Val dehydrogenase dimerization domain-containing protein [Nannocystis bainbridge]|uniref:Glu/Leu/Phe/Val dehydrogenase dimerization domain-containing protein n=1 Tax=Nannocystis bainbridge TaxID=2995303 RepID=A0ABT5ECW1_9BACT|nr:Glu/Leu/Phe/Val dehydrogenase dimerization domain-containing protein [Nannocystis bainbridge]MDC0723719.1 Glu/Leu/Phe/Val dehydrogenase dimerization domain-containing protein [Nannocystis bainbridge]
MATRRALRYDARPGGGTVALLKIEYRDPIEPVSGLLVIDRLVDGVCAGGLRIAADVEADEIAALARNMTRKQAAYALPVGGAKAGLRMAPDHPARGEVLRRFLSTVAPLIERSWSVGPDLNTTMAELQRAAGDVGLPCLKLAVGRSRGLADREFLRRYAMLDGAIDGWSVHALRAPAAVRAATLALARALGRSSGLRVAIQGAGAMGGGAAYLLDRIGCRVVAWADDLRCLVDEGGLDVATLLAGRREGRLPAVPGEARPSAEILHVPCDLLILAAVSRAVAVDAVPRLGCAGVVEAANLALAPDVADALHAAGVLVIPDLLASAGGSLAVEALYAGDPSGPADVLAHVERRVAARVEHVLADSRTTGRSPRALLEEALDGR